MLLFGSRIWTEKRKLNAATLDEVPTPTIFPDFENTSTQLHVAQARPPRALMPLQQALTGAVGVALPVVAPALPQAAVPRALGHLPNGERLPGR